MRRKILMGAVAVVLTSGQVDGLGAQDMGMADLDDFTLETGQDLVDLCSVDEGHAMYSEAIMFCLGVMEGVIQYHDAMAHGPDGRMIVCPEEEVTRSQAVEIFVTWGEANPDEASSAWPAEAVVLAALDRWGECDR